MFRDNRTNLSIWQEEHFSIELFPELVYRFWTQCIYEGSRTFDDKEFQAQEQKSNNLTTQKDFSIINNHVDWKYI